MCAHNVDKNRQLIVLSQHPNARFWRLELDQLNEHERVFRLIWELEAVVNNGGFDQYFCNAPGDTAAGVPAALESIGAVNTAAIVREARALYADSQASQDRDDRDEAELDPSHATLSALNDRFFAYPDNLTNLLHAYVASHAAAIAGADEALAWRDPLDDDRNITSRTCPHCAALCPRYRKSCKQCGQHVGRAI